MATHTIKTQINLPKEQYNFLTTQAKEKRMSLSKIIQSVLGKYIKQEQSSNIFTDDDTLWQIVGTGTSKISDGSVNHDQYIYGTKK